MKAVSAVVAVVALVAACGFVQPAAAQAVTDVDILNFALNLEYLEAEFYNRAVYGRGLPSNLTGGGPTPTGGMKANLTGEVLAIATEIAKDELNHVAFLRAALGSAAVPRPRMNLGTSFSAAADAAFNMTLSPPFNPYANDLFFMHGAFIFEDVGVTAYKGAAALINNSDYLTAAAGILAVEAYHAGTVREYLYRMANTTTPYNVTVETIVGAISALRATLSGADDDQGVVVNGTANIVPTDSDSIVFSRTPAQVVKIVTFGSMNATGGFFPSGLNSTLATAAAVNAPAAAPSGSASAPGPAAGTPGGAPAAGTPGGAPAAGTPGGAPAAGTPGGAPAAGTPGGAPAPAPQAASTAAAPSVAALVAASVLGVATLLAA